MSKANPNPNTIENAKSNSPDLNLHKLGSFAKGLAAHAIICGGIITVGATGLYFCKLAQANVLPDNINLAPFGNRARDVVNNLPIQMHILKEYNFPEWAHGLGWVLGQSPTGTFADSATFNHADILKSYYGGLVGKLNGYKHSGNYFLYFCSIITDLIVLNNYIINTAYSAMGSVCSEWFIVILCTLLFPFLIISSIGGNLIGALWYAFMEIKQLFKNINHETGSIESDADFGTTMFHYLRPLKAMWAGLLFMVGLVPICLIGIGAAIYSWIAPLFIPYSVSGKPKTFIDFIMDGIASKKQLIMILTSMSLVSQTGSSLGGIYMIAAIIAVLIAIYMDLFKTNAMELLMNPVITGLEPAPILATVVSEGAELSPEQLQQLNYNPRLVKPQMQQQQQQEERRQQPQQQGGGGGSNTTKVKKTKQLKQIHLV